MKVALVVPKKHSLIDATCIPFGLAYIASYLKNVVPTVEVKIIDGGIGQNIGLELYLFQPNIVGVSASTPQAPDAYRLGDELRRNSPSVLTVIGGVHASALPSEALQHFDCVVVGEGEIAFTRIVQDFIDGKRSRGIIQGEPIADLNTLPSIDYYSLDIKAYMKCGVEVPLLSNPCLNLTFSRGCVYRCVFCHNSGRTTKVRYFNAERIAREILFLHEKFGVDTFYFSDDEFLINTERLKELNVLFHKYGIVNWIKWGCQARSQTCTVETLKLAKDAGCLLVSLGLESGCERTLQYLKQGTTALADHELALHNCGEVGVLVGGNFIYGVFDQSLEEMQESFRWMQKQRNIAFVGNGVLIPYPGTEVWRKSKELKLLPEDVDYSRLILTYYAKETYVVNQVVPLKVFARFMVNTARMTRVYAKRNYLGSLWKFTKAMWRQPVFYWAWLFHPLQMFKLTFRRKQK